MNETLHTSRVLHQYYRPAGLPERAALDPATILLIGKLVVEVLKALWECYDDPADIARACQSPGFVARRRLYRLLRAVPADKRAAVAEAFRAAGRLSKPGDFT